MKEKVEKLSGLDVWTDGSSTAECVEALSGVGEMCRQDGAEGEVNRMAFGEVREVSPRSPLGSGYPYFYSYGVPGMLYVV